VWGPAKEALYPHLALYLLALWLVFSLSSIALLCRVYPLASGVETNVFIFLCYQPSQFS
jgi:hypothetical protein